MPVLMIQSNGSVICGISTMRHWASLRSSAFGDYKTKDMKTAVKIEMLESLIITGV